MNKNKKIVCFGGGTGLPALLSGLKNNPWLSITAVVNMFDTGGSSGELKDRFGILPPGDVLKCLLSLSNREDSARELLLKRINNQKYNGHTGGNILLLGLEKVFGDYISAIDALGQLLFVKGKVYPVTLKQSNLCAEYSDKSIFKGETNIDFGIHEGKFVKKLFLEPNVPASNEAINAIKEADAICIGPGSFYTSVLPNFLPEGITEEISLSKAKVIFIANLLTEGKGMQGMSLEDIVKTVENYIKRKVDHVVANEHLPIDNDVLDRYKSENKYPIIPSGSKKEIFVFSDLWDDKNIARHNSTKLSYVVSGLLSNL